MGGRVREVGAGIRIQRERIAGCPCISLGAQAGPLRGAVRAKDRGWEGASRTELREEGLEEIKHTS